MLHLTGAKPLNRNCRPSVEGRRFLICQLGGDDHDDSTTQDQHQYSGWIGTALDIAEIGAELSLARCPIIARHLGNPALLRELEAVS